jgi:hypothetical protein
MKEKIAKLFYKLLRPFIEIEWEKSFESYGTVFRILIFGKVVSEAIYSPAMGSLREKFERQ